jgi:hypothetical protein
VPSISDLSLKKLPDLCGGHRGGCWGSRGGGMERLVAVARCSPERRMGGGDGGSTSTIFATSIARCGTGLGLDAGGCGDMVQVGPM